MNPLALAWPGVVLLVGLAFAACLAVYLMRRRDLDEELLFKVDRQADLSRGFAADLERVESVAAKATAAAQDALAQVVAINNRLPRLK